MSFFPTSQAAIDYAVKTWGNVAVELSHYPNQGWTVAIAPNTDSVFADEEAAAIKRQGGRADW